MRQYIEILGIIIVNTVLAYVFLLSGFWYGLIIAGFISTIIFYARPSVTLLSVFLSSILGAIIFMTPLFLEGLSKLMYYTGIIAGINGNILILLIFLLSGAMGLAGGLIGNYIRATVKKSPLDKNRA
jgi:hypothetical protein